MGRAWEILPSTAQCRGDETCPRGASQWAKAVFAIAIAGLGIGITHPSTMAAEANTILFTLPGGTVAPGGVIALPLERTDSAEAPDTVVLKLAFDTTMLEVCDVVAGEASAGKMLTWRQTDSGLAALFYGGSGAVGPGLVATLYLGASSSVDPTTIAVTNNGSSASTAAAEQREVALARGAVVVVPLARPHSADTSHNGRIELAELLRAIQLFNAGQFACDGDSEDGYGLSGDDQSCAPHDLDYITQNWRLELSELLRCIQFYNAFKGAYHDDELGEDGFAAGPATP